MDHQNKSSKDFVAVRIANCELMELASDQLPDATWQCCITVRDRGSELHHFVGEADDLQQAVAAAISPMCLAAIHLQSVQHQASSDSKTQVSVCVSEIGAGKRSGVGRGSGDCEAEAVVIAALRGASHAGLLKANFRANNQKLLRAWSKELVDEVVPLLTSVSPLTTHNRLEAESVTLDRLNHVASAAVITASNSPKPDTILSLFDTSAWLFDPQGGRRDSYTNTDLWLAWYPGVENGELTADEVIRSMPAAPPSAIPWIVRLLENPSSWLRFRGAIDLEDHDVLHVLLGRGLQDQDEAFVLGFAMGTAKRINWLQYHLFKFALARIYPEPYRIPRYLQPAFDLGVQCGKQTGTKNLYKSSLKRLRHLPLDQARAEAGIDMSLVKQYYQREQQAIPFTIASLRLP